MSPQEVIDSAPAGSTIRLRLCGPSTLEERIEVKTEHEARYEGLIFVVDSEPGETFSAEVDG